MKNRLKENKGITLIALVITIIVLLILAGVAISMLSGDNGILRQAARAKNDTEIAKVEELAKLAYNAALMEDRKASKETLIGAVVNELQKHNYKVREEKDEQVTITDMGLNKNKVSMELESGTTKIDITLTIDSSSSIKYYVLINEKYYEMTMGEKGVKIAKDATNLSDDTSGEADSAISVSIEKEGFIETSLTKNTSESYKLTITPKKEGNVIITLKVNGTEISKTIEVEVIKPLLAGSIPVDAYGDVVTNYEVGDSTYQDNNMKWRIFLADNNNIYLIASNYAMRSRLPHSCKGNTLNSGDLSRSAYFVNIANDYEGSSNIVGNDKLSQTLTTYYKWANKHPTATYENIRIVAYMLDTEVWSGYAGNSADYAIGAPTLEMFCASYNKTHSDTIDYKENYAYGYQMKWSKDSSYSSSISGLDTKEIDNLYVINNTSNALAMYLAAPCAGSDSYRYRVNFDGSIIYHGYTNKGGLRPVICLNSNTKLARTGEKTWKIVE